MAVRLERAECRRHSQPRTVTLFMVDYDPEENKLNFRTAKTFEAFPEGTYRALVVEKNRNFPEARMLFRSTETGLLPVSRQVRSNDRWTLDV